MLDAAKRFAAGEGNLKALNPDWDNTFLDQLAANDLAAIDAYTNDSIKELGGQSGQETRNWIAAYAGLSTTPTHHCLELAETAHAAADECSDLSIGCVAMRRSDELSPIPRGCCERNCVRNAAQRRRWGETRRDGWDGGFIVTCAFETECVGGDGDWLARNPEVAGSNPVPATKKAASDQAKRWILADSRFLFGNVWEL